ncbi:putative mitogen-activated protein kinase kinase kinase 7-like [Drosophila eugracilis]|uniref:putative mitogen-activated protein kinase kinase kinase 7-like n=1 Tax=Drosophila eugracilis TaxID=29029 RepID=UPI001BDB1B50|nr:putative mitogen-activated protein kinase kinase kinase 7-like [Drosophila eugracilis]
MAKKVNIADIKLSQKLGSGTGGVVHKATFQDEEIAVKVFDTQHPTNKKNAEREIIHLSHISHENVIKIFGTAKDGDKEYLLMEYLKDGSVHDLLYGSNQWEYTVEQAVRWAFQGAKGLAYLHSLDRPVVHRDIKPQNMLLDNMFEKLKICDFGLATDMSNNQSDMRGTVRYMAPEAIRYTKYTDKCDVYSFGIVLWEIMARKVPYSHLENADQAFSIMEAIVQGDRPDMNEVRPDCPQGIKQLIKCCVDEDPEKRPSMKEIEVYLDKCVATFAYYNLINQSFFKLENACKLA